MFFNHQQNIRIVHAANILSGFLMLLVFLFNSPVNAVAQEPGQIQPDTIGAITDSLNQSADSLKADTLAASEKIKEKGILEAPVIYASEDSFIISMGEQKTYLFKDASVDYQNISLKANYIEFNIGTNTVIASGMVDSAGLIAGKPIFKQGADEYDSDTIRYNFESHKGIIKNIITKQGDGYLHSTRTKRLEDGEIHISKGKYTTCDDPHPHFYIRLTKAIAIPKDKILSGPAYMVMEDIPLPLALPFGFFPNTTTRSSGLIIPTYGEEQTRGFYLRNGGWYFALNDYFDLTLLGSVYSRGTWGLSGSSVYKVNYKFNGRFNAEFVKNQVKDDPEYVESSDFKITWNHSQDAKANPSQRFSASVNFSTHAYDKNQSYNINEYLTNTKSSSISYSKTWEGSPFNLTANLQHSQNSKNNTVNLSLPIMAFNMNRVYPFRGKNDDGKYNWFENIQVSYAAKLENRINATDSTLFTKKTLENMSNGFSHSIPISLTNIKILHNFVNITPGISYNGVLYTKYIQKTPVYTDTSLYINEIRIDTIDRVTYAQSLSASLSISVNPKFYGNYQSTKPNSYVAIVRHVMSPSASFSFSPDMSGVMPNYYRTLATNGSVTQPLETEEYSVYEGQIYGTPSVNGRSGSLSLRLNNTLEMKVRPKNDTTGELKKVSILDNLNFSTGYSPFVDHYHWSNLAMTGSTTLFEKKVNVQFSTVFNPYALDSSGNKVDKYLIKEDGKLFRTTNARITIGFDLKSAAGDKKESLSTTAPEGEPRGESNPTLDALNESPAYYGDYVDYDIPWTLRVDYSWAYTKERLTPSFTHTIRLGGDISLTPKWKISMNTGYDFIAKAFTMTNINFHRDLHCWEMRFSVVPFGERRSYSFSISAKSSILRDVKYNKSQSWRDNF